jgi:Ethanolamine utilization protein EutJ (predicted chaperonin)
MEDCKENMTSQNKAQKWFSRYMPILNKNQDIAGSHNNVAKCEEWLAEACCMGLRIVQSILNVHWEC